MRLLPSLLLASVATQSGCGNINRNLGYQGERDTFSHSKSAALREFDAGNYSKAIEIGETAYALRQDDRDLSHVLAHAHMAVVGLDPAFIIEYVQAIQNSEGGSGNVIQLFKNITMLDGIVPIEEQQILRMSRDDDAGAAIGRSDHPLFSGLNLNVPKPVDAMRRDETDYLAHLDRAIRIACPYVDKSVRVTKASRHTLEDQRHVDAACSSQHDASNESSFHYLWVLAHIVDGAIMARYLEPNLAVLTQRFNAISAAKSSADVEELVDLLGENLTYLQTIYPSDEAAVSEAIVPAVVNDIAATIEGYREVVGVDVSASGDIPLVLDAIKTQKTTLGTKVLGFQDIFQKLMFRALADYFGHDAPVALRRRVCSMIADAITTIDEDECVINFYELGTL